MSHISAMKWINELLCTKRDKFVLERYDNKRLYNLIIQRIIKLIETNNMGRVLFYITELVYEGHMTTTFMKTIVYIACKYKRYTFLNNLFKNRLTDCDMVYFVLGHAYKMDDIGILETITRNHTNDLACIIDMIYTAIAHKAEKSVMYLLRTFKHCCDDIIIACIEMEMYTTVKYILNMGIIDDIDAIFTALCSVNNKSLIKLYIMLFPNVNMKNGLMIANMNGFIIPYS